MSEATYESGYAGSRRSAQTVKFSSDQDESSPVASTISVDKPISKVESASTEAAGKLSRLPQSTATRTAKPLSLWAYAATGGSLAVAVSGLASLLVPDRWELPTWVALAMVLCTGVGLVADRFVE